MNFDRNKRNIPLNFTSQTQAEEKREGKKSIRGEERIQREKGRKKERRQTFDLPSSFSNVIPLA